MSLQHLATVFYRREYNLSPDVAKELVKRLEAAGETTISSPRVVKPIIEQIRKEKEVY